MRRRGDGAPVDVHGARCIYITDAEGRVGGPFELVLIVRPRPPTFVLPERLRDAPIGEPYEEWLCDPPSERELDCGSDPPSVNPSGGLPPYSFAATGLPLGLTLSMNGLLHGTPREGLTPQAYDVTVCVTDRTRFETCASTVIHVVPEPEPAAPTPGACPSPYEGRWTGTAHGKGILYNDPPPHEPYDITYAMSFAVTCKGGGLEGRGWEHALEDVTLSHPFFGCASGCQPATAALNLPAPGESGGLLVLSSWNGELYQVSALGLVTASDGNTITVTDSGFLGENNREGATPTLEQHGCYPRCYGTDIDKQRTITLARTGG